MKEVEFKNSLGKVLKGTHYKGGLCGIILVHGFTGDRHEWGKFDLAAEMINDKGFSVLSFDFSGCGESDDEALSVERQIDDLKSAISFFKGIGIKNIGLLGYSLGALVSCYCYDEGIGAMVLWAPVTDRMDITNLLDEKQIMDSKDQGKYVKTRNKGIRQRFVIDANMIEERKNVNQKELLSSIKCPVLIIHGEDDVMVPLEQSRSAQKLLERCELEVFEDNHLFDKTYEKVAKISADWFKEQIDL